MRSGPPLVRQGAADSDSEPRGAWGGLDGDSSVHPLGFRAPGSGRVCSSSRALTGALS